MRKYLLTFILVGLLLIASACGARSGASDGKIIKTVPVGNLTATLSNESGQLKHGDEEVMLKFTDASGKPVEVGAVALTFGMQSMGTMPAMRDQASFTTTGTPGAYRGKVNVEMAGEWQATITYDGPAGRGQASFPVAAR